jgi:hypothetical protein
MEASYFIQDVFNLGMKKTKRYYVELKKILRYVRMNMHIHFKTPYVVLLH